MSIPLSRRRFLKGTLAAGASVAMAGEMAEAVAAAGKGSKMRLGMVTYQWGKDWDLPTLIANLEKAKVLGVELRTTHKHGVEPSLSAAQRAEVKKRFDDSPVVLAGIGSDERLDDPDPGKLAKAVEKTKAFIQLSHDVGGSGVKVKPNSFHKDVPREKTIEQIGTTLNAVARFAADYGQQIRLEVHGQCAELPIMKQIMGIATDRNAAVCWNSNGTDLKGQGLEHNFGLVKDRFGATTHIRPLDVKGYPWQELIGLLVKMDYAGWLLIEASDKREDYVAALAKQQGLLDQMRAKAQQAV
ncbi:MAG TPA: TIM barrel protein [Phycisphaerae bacterium]|nr:TIM barrel protein [Phycisphaerae bacterium]